MTTTVHALVFQLQALLGALNLLIGLAPAATRGRLVEVLDLARVALAAVDAGAEAIGPAVDRLRTLRAEVEAMVEEGRPVSADLVDAALTRVAAASAAFRAAADPPPA